MHFLRVLYCRRQMLAVVLSLQTLFGIAASSNENPYSQFKASPSAAGSLEVDLGYATYKGFKNESTGLNHWLGVRYAEAPIGSLRWQLPSVPHSTNETIDASSFGSMCPQSPDGFPGSTSFQPSNGVSEDCLVLNIYAPPDAKNLPVLFWIHGGGYGIGNNQNDVPFLISNANSSFVGVAIQYRLGAFGFLSSEAVKQSGVVNAGLHDQILALEWVQYYISLFGGNPSEVTIFGESAGAGSVMLQAMAYGGANGTSLFRGIIAASPYLPGQYAYSDTAPTQVYNEFVSLAGCQDSSSAFHCLVEKPSETLQNASYTVSADGKYGQWAFLPVTDFTLVEERPSVQLLSRKVNGARLLIGNNADEGVMFVPQNITTEDDFVQYITSLFPLFDESEIEQILVHYPSTSGPVDPEAVRFATTGTGFPTALNQSSFATGQQQRANNLYAEVTFVCPSYWFADAFDGNGKTSYKYQFSVIPALHGYDSFTYFGPLGSNMSPSFQQAFISMYRSFIVNGNVASTISEIVPSDAANVIKAWPVWTQERPIQINFNQTGGVLTTTTDNIVGINITEPVKPGLSPKFGLADAYTWEGGRGQRCEFWRKMGAKIPE